MVCDELLSVTVGNVVINRALTVDSSVVECVDAGCAAVVRGDVGWAAEVCGDVGCATLVCADVSCAAVVCANVDGATVFFVDVVNAKGNVQH